MNRFNQILWAVIGLLFLGMILLLASQFLLWRKRDGGNGVAAGTTADVKAKKGTSTRIACLPIRVPGSNYQLIPVAVLRFEDTPMLASYASRSGAPGLCRMNGVEVGGAIDVLNMVVRDTTSGKQRLLLDTPALIEDVEFPVEPSQGSSPDCCNVPAGKLFWTIRTADTDQNRVINRQDALGAYVTDLAGDHLTRLMPEGASFLGVTYDRTEESLYVLSYRDSAVDGKLGEGEHAGLTRVRLSTMTLEHDIVDPALSDRLAQLTGTPTERERLLACCQNGCINDSGGEAYCQKACANELSTHPDKLASIYCPEFLP